jgi:hypothetical protein
MTETEIDALVAGAELDSLIAKEVMGWGGPAQVDDGLGVQTWEDWIVKQGNLPGRYQAWDPMKHFHGEYKRVVDWSPSTDLNDAWEALNDCSHCTIQIRKDGWYCGLTRKWAELRRPIWLGNDGPQSCAMASTAPLAICRALLKTTLP